MVSRYGNRDVCSFISVRLPIRYKVFVKKFRFIPLDAWQRKVSSGPASFAYFVSCTISNRMVAVALMTPETAVILLK
jgi:hypothetical protein